MIDDAFPTSYLVDIYTEAPSSDDTLSNLGPLAPFAGVWEGDGGVDTHPQVDGPETQPYVERWTFELIDRQTNGPQLFYGLRYHTHITNPGEVETFHDQVGYLLWEPATSSVLMTLAIPRGQVAMAGGVVAPDARAFTLRAAVGDPHFGIVTNPFLDAAFHTTAWEITFRVLDDALAYTQTTTLQVHGDAEPFAHQDANRLVRVGLSEPNPLAAADASVTAAAAGSGP